MANVIKHKRGSGSDPVASDLVVGEVAIRTDVGKLFTKMDNGTVAEIAGGGSDIAINTLSSSSATGGGSATFNGSAYRFTLSAPPSVSAQQLLVSINGVIQKPVAGTGQPSEGFSVDGTDIILGDAPATGSDFFILTFKSLGVSEPADNSVTNAKVASNAAIAGTKISPNFGSQTVTASNLTLSDNDPIIQFTDANNDPDYRILVESGIFRVQDTTNSNAERLTIDSSGDIGIGTSSPTLSTFGSNTGGIEISDVGSSANALLVQSGSNEFFFANTSSANYIYGADNAPLIISTNGSERMRIKSNGTVGIGTTTPQKLLDVRGEFAISNSNASYWDFDRDDSDGSLKIKDTGTERLRIDSSGHLLLGTTTAGEGTADDFTIAGAGHTGMTIRSGSSSECNIFFADGTSGNARFRGMVRYFHDSDALAFNTSAVERLRIDSSGNVGVGESASIDARLHVNSGTDNATLFIESTDGDVNLCMADNAGSCRLLQSAGDLHFRTGGNANAFGTGDSERMVIDSSGKVGIGTTTIGNKLQVHEASSNASFAGFSNDTTGSSSSDGLIVGVDSDENGVLYHYENKAIRFATNNTERMRIDSSGNIAIGNTSPQQLLHVWPDTANTSSAFIRVSSGDRGSGTGIDLGSDSDGDGRLNVVSNANLKLYTNDTERMRIDSSGKVGIGTTNPSANLHSYHASDNEAARFESGDEYVHVVFKDSTTTNEPYIGAQGNNLRAITGGAERVRIDSSGNVLVGTTSTTVESLTSAGQGVKLAQSGRMLEVASNAQPAVGFNRTGDDGTIVRLIGQGSLEGTITVSGSSVSYNGGHLSRWSQFKGLSQTDKSDRPTIYQGTVMSNLDDLCVWEGEDNQQLNMTKISDVVGDKDVAGVFYIWDDDDDKVVNDFYIAMTGDLVIRVAASTTVARGDLLISAGDGTAKPQADDIIRSSTIAKIISINHTATYPDGSKAYPCVLMAC